MSRLPAVSGDANAWGSILNDFLSVAHNSNGSLKNLFINLKDYCKIDGSTDDSIGFTTAYTLASSLGMGLYMPGGTLVKGNDTLLSNVPIDLGGGTIKLKNGANTDLFSAQTGSINLSAAFGSGPVGTLSGFSIRNGTLDGNKANQTSGTSYPLRFYGYKFLLRDLEIINGYSGPALIDWNGNLAEGMEAVIDHVTFRDSNGIGLQIGGPHDSRLIDVLSFNNGSHNFHICPNATGILSTNCHGYLNPNTAGIVDWLVEANGCQFVNCVAEGSYVCDLAIIAAGCSWVGGNIYASAPGWTSVVGIQLGQRSGQTPFPGQINQSAGVTTAIVASGCMIQTMISECRGGAISFQNEASNTIEANVYQTVGTALVGPNTPLISGADNYRIRVNGLTPDGSVGKSGGMQLVTSAFNGFLMFDQAGNNTFDFNANNAIFLVGNSGHIQGFSDAFFSTQQFDLACANGNIWTNGWLATGQSATAPDPGASGTVATANVGEARVNPSGASRAGCILAVGTRAGQEVWVVNEHATNTISWATEATSHIAGEAGGTFVLNGKRGQKFVWDSGIALWVKAS